MGPKQAESAAAALLRLAGEYEFVRHITGVLYALKGTADPIGLDALIGRLARRYAKSGKVASAEARKSVRELLDDPDAPERDLTEQLEIMLARLREKRASQVAAREAEFEAAREVELAEVREEAAPLLQETNLVERFGKAIEHVVVGDDAVRAAKLLKLVLATRHLDEKRVGSELIKGQSAVGKTFLSEIVLDFLPPASVLKANSMSPKALFYRGLDEAGGACLVDLSHQVIYLGEEPPPRTSSSRSRSSASFSRMARSSNKPLHRRRRHAAGHPRARVCAGHDGARETRPRARDPLRLGPTR